MKKEFKSKEYRSKEYKSTLTKNIIGFCLGLLGQSLKYIDNFPNDYLPTAQYSLWVISTAFLIVPWIIWLDRILDSLRVTAGISEQLPNKLNELTIWRRNEHQSRIKITVSDFDDYLILLPLHLSVFFLKGMDVEFETRCCGSDRKALEELASGRCKFAITDPHYLNEFPNDDFVLLAPLITKSPMWWLSHSLKKGQPSKPHPIIFSYEQRDASGSLTYTSRMLDAQIAKYGWKSGDYEVYTIPTVVEQLCEKLANVVKDGDGSLIDSYGGLARIKQEQSIAAFECLLFSCTDDTDVRGLIKNTIKDFFLQFDYFLLTEPDSSYVAKVFSLKQEPVSLDNDYIFTGIITTRKYLHAYPVESLKMLRGLRDGLLKSNIALMNKDANTIKRAFQEALAYKRGSIESEQKKHLFINAFKNIDRFLLDESFFPDDLILLDTGKKFTPSDDALYRMYVQKYEKFILRSFEAGGKESDLNNESIRFIIKGLGYDC